MSVGSIVKPLFIPDIICSCFIFLSIGHAKTLSSLLVFSKNQYLFFFVDLFNVFSAITFYSFFLIHVDIIWY